LLVEPRLAPLSDKNEVGSIGDLALQQRKHPQPVPGEQAAVARIPEALGIEYLGLNHQSRLLGPAGGLQGQHQAVRFGLGCLAARRPGTNQAQSQRNS
jgi:hypothetical protein